MTQSPTPKTDRREYYREYRKRNKHKWKRVTVTLTTDEYQRFNKLALRESRTVPEQIKLMALTEFTNIRPAPRELVVTVKDAIRELRRIGNNVNQLTKRVHSERGGIFRRHLRQAPELLRTTIAELNQIESSIRSTINSTNE